MSDMNSKSRHNRGFFTDTRFLVGIVLVVVSITGVWLVLSSAKETETVLQSSRTILPGEMVTTADFRTIEVGLGVAQSNYLTPQQLVPGSIATRTISSGELVPASALGAASSARTTTIVISSASGIPDSLSRGDRVEVWAARPVLESRGYETPYLLLGSATVAAVDFSQGLISQAAARIELVIDRSDVPQVLGALSEDSMLSIIPIGAGS